MGMDQAILVGFDIEGSSDSPVVIMDIRLARPPHSTAQPFQHFKATQPTLGYQPRETAKVIPST